MVDLHESSLNSKAGWTTWGMHR